MAKSPKGVKNIKDLKGDMFWEIKGLLFICAGVLAFFSNYTDAIGVIGVFLKRNMGGLVGKTSISIPLALILLGTYQMYKRHNPKSVTRIIGMVTLLSVMALMFHIQLHTKMSSTFFERLKHSAELGVKGVGGGILGETLATLLISVFGVAGTYIITSTFAIIGILLTTGLTLAVLFKGLRYKKRVNQSSPATKPEEIKVLNFSHTGDLVKETEKAIQKNSIPAAETSKPEKSSGEDKPILINIVNSVEAEYTLPPLSLLKGDGPRHIGMSEKELINNAKVLEDTLASFSVSAKVVQVSCGPTITRFEVHPSPGVKVSRIVNLADDIALSLAAQDVRIEAPIPGKAAIGIEVPNKKKSVVYLRDILETAEFNAPDSKLTFALGKDVGGNPIVSDLTDMPHLLIAGATGSGKSVCVNSIITSILYKANPHEVRVVMIDPKVVELAVYDGIPHLLTPVVTDAKKASSALFWLVTEMEKRYLAFAEVGVRDIGRYNELFPESPYPKIVIIIDELADLMMVSPRETEDNICRLAQMARAAGMHLVVATQRPSVDVITGLIKANIPSRLSFAVSSQVDSRTILDMAGAEKLLGKGDMLFFPVGASKPVRIQGAYISEEEVEKLVDYIKGQHPPTYEKNLEDFKDFDNGIRKDSVDDLFEEAVYVVLDSGKASTSYLQRRLKIGYNRAADLMEQLQDKNIITAPDGNKPREVLMTREQYEKYFRG